MLISFFNHPVVQKPERLFAPICLLIVPFTAYIQHNSYPLARLETVTAISLIACLGILVGVLAYRLTDTVRCIVYAALLLLCVDIHMGTQWITLLEQYSGGQVLAALMLCFLAVVCGFWLIHEHLESVIIASSLTTAFFTVLLELQTIDSAVAQQQQHHRATTLAPVLHIILDEQIGIEGLPANIPGANVTARFLKQFYRDHQFSLYGAAYSHFPDTKRSLSRLVNGSSEPDLSVFTKTVNDKLQVRENAWFNALSQQGYSIRVYQSDYMDFCKPQGVQVQYCYTYASNSIQTLANIDVKRSYKLRIILHRFIARSTSYKLVMRAWRNAEQKKLVTTDEVWLGGLSTYPVFKRIAQDMTRQANGVAFFAHLLLPHSSYIFDRNCLARSNPGTWFRNFDHLQTTLANSPASRQQRYKYYLDQVHCTHHALENLFRRMKQLGVYDHATIIVHGDHGSRIALNPAHKKSIEELTGTDLRDSYSTLMAFHSRKLTPAYSRAPLSIQSLFSNIILGRPLTINNKLFLNPTNSSDNKPFPFVPASRLFE